VLAIEAGAASLPVIAPACHDTGSAVVAVPAQNQDFAWLSSGTWSIMGAEVRLPNLSPQALAYNFTNEGGVNSTWRLSKNIMGLWIVQECRRAWAAQGNDYSYADLTRLASSTPPFIAVIDPDAELFFHPGDMPARVCNYCKDSGQIVPGSPGEIIRVVLESLALKYRLTLQQLEQLVGRRLDPIHIIGGGSQNRLLNQLTADCTGRTVVVGPVEATAIGNIIMQAIPLGHLASLSEARLMVRRSFDVETYHPARSVGWDAAYEKMLSLSGSIPA
jgi:sugar (pentulose or hexulose) kinase